MAAPDLTTLAAVQEHVGALATGHDDLINSLITSVSQDFESYTRRTLAQVASVARIYRTGTCQSVIVLDQWPNATPVVTENGTALVNNTDYELRDDRRLVRISGNYDIAWARDARVSATMHEGYASIPADLALRCREQVAFAFLQSDPGGQHLGVATATTQSGSQETYTTYDFLASVVRTLDQYRRFAL